MRPSPPPSPPLLGYNAAAAACTCSVLRHVTAGARRRAGSSRGHARRRWAGSMAASSHRLQRQHGEKGSSLRLPVAGHMAGTNREGDCCIPQSPCSVRAQGSKTSNPQLLRSRGGLTCELLAGLAPQLCKNGCPAVAALQSRGGWMLRCCTPVDRAGDLAAAAAAPPEGRRGGGSAAQRPICAHATHGPRGGRARPNAAHGVAVRGQTRPTGWPCGPRRQAALAETTGCRWLSAAVCAGRPFS